MGALESSRRVSEPRGNHVSARSLGIVLLVVAAGHLSLFPRVADLDGFYHLGHALAYADGSVFDTSLPWATQSVIADRGADLWWGFHLVLLPFTTAGDVEAGIRLGAGFLTLVLAGGFLWVLRRHCVPGAGWWTAAFLVAVPNVFFRHLMLRPHVLSLTASLLLLSVLVRGRWWQALGLSALVTWLHLGLFWMGPGIAVAYALVRSVEQALGDTEPRGSVPTAAALAAVLAGTVLGWLLRPHPIEAGALASVQIIRLLAEKASEEPLTFAAELLPIPPAELARTAWLFLGVWTTAAALAAVRAVKGRLTLAPEERTLLLGSVLISATFLMLALVSARRAMVEWVAFGALVLPLAAAVIGPLPRRRGALPALTLLVAAHVGWGAWRHSLNVDQVAFRPDTMREVADFLERSSEPGAVVFHAKWDNFGPLFARNRSNRYLGGMDPIFQLAHDPRRYWEFFYLSTDATSEWTCDAFPCATGNATDTHLALVEHFGARWVVVEPRRNPRLSLYLLNDPRFELALETEREAVFEILRGAGPGA